jgi:hypothetical protein
MILAAVSSGRSLLVTSRPTKALRPLSATAAIDSTGTPAAPSVAASKPVVRTVSTFTASVLCTVATALPA